MALPVQVTAGSESPSQENQADATGTSQGTGGNPSSTQNLQSINLSSSGISSDIEGLKFAPTGKTNAQGDEIIEIIVPMSLALGFIIDDVCRARNKENRINNWVDGFIPQKTDTKEERFSHSSYSVTLPRDMSVTELSKAAAQDPCIVGVAPDPRFKSVLTANTSGEKATEYLKQIEFIDGMAEIAESIKGQKVKVAVIDTGLDPSVSSILRANAPAAGLDMVERDDTPQDTSGHGTIVSSLIAATGAGAGMPFGLAGNIAEIIPVRLVDKETALITSSAIFDAIKRAVNSGAEVINMSLGYISKPTELCSPIIGHALHQAIQRNVTIVMAAGNALPSENGAMAPGELTAPSDNAPHPRVYNFAPGCWGQYFKGAVSVGSLRTGSEILSDSNFGTAVEIAAPGTNIPALSLGGAQTQISGTSAANSLVTSAMALIIAYHKAKGWDQEPWLMEDILLNSSPKRAALEKAISRGTVLNFRAIASYLRQLDTLTAEQRKQEPSYDYYEGSGWQPTANENPTVSQLTISTKTPIVYRKDRVKFNVVAQFSNGGYTVANSAAKWSSSNSQALEISNNGIAVVANTAAPGAYTVSAAFGGKTATSKITVVDVDPLFGTNERLVGIKVELVPDNNLKLASGRFNLCARQGSFKALAYALYSGGTVRNVSKSASFGSDSPTYASGSWLGYPCFEAAEKEYSVTATYLGLAGEAKYSFEKCNSSPLSIQIDSHWLADSSTVVETVGRSIQLLLGNQNSRQHSFFKTKSVALTNLATGVSTQVKINDAPTCSQNAFLPALAPGRYKVDASVIFRGSGSDEILSSSRVVEIKKPVIESIYFRQTNLWLPYGQEESMEVYGRSSLGDVYPTRNELNLSFQTMNGINLPLSWMLKDRAGGIVYDVTPMDKVKVTAVHIPTGLSVEKVFRVFGMNGKHRGNMPAVERFPENLIQSAAITPSSNCPVNTS